MHALIQSDLDSGFTFVEDLDSTNGTSFKGGLNLIPRRMYQLLDGQVLKFGPSTCTFNTAQTLIKVKGIDCKEILHGTPRMEDVNPKVWPQSSPVIVDPANILSPQAKKLNSGTEIAGLGNEEKFDVTSANGSDGNVDAAESVVLDWKESQNIDLDVPLPHNDEVTHSHLNGNYQSESSSRRLEKEAENQKQLALNFLNAAESTSHPPKVVPIKVLKTETSKLEDFKISDEEDIQAPIIYEKRNREADYSLKAKNTYAKRNIALSSQGKNNTKSKLRTVGPKELETFQITVPGHKLVDLNPRPINENMLFQSLDEALSRDDGKKSPTITPKSSKLFLAKKALKKPLSVSEAVLKELDAISSTRKRKRIGSSAVRILFAGGCDNPKNVKIVSKLGGQVVKDWSQCTHMVTDKLKRTIKFLCCLSSGRQIVDPQWLYESLEDNQWLGREPINLDAEKYLIRDPEAEEKFDFRLRDSLTITSNSSHSRLLHNMKFYSTISVQPPTEELRSIIESAGGKV